MGLATQNSNIRSNVISDKWKVNLNIGKIGPNSE